MLKMNAQGGVWKWILIVVLVLIVVACVGVYLVVHMGGNYLKSHGKELASGMVVKALRMQIDRNLPAGYDRSKVEDTFKGLEQAMKEGKVKPEALSPIGNEIGTAMQKGNLTTQDVDKILEDIRKLSAPTSS